jgi:hypothetical protein
MDSKLPPVVSIELVTGEPARVYALGEHEEQEPELAALMDRAAVMVAADPQAKGATA